jgi:SAM-dependent methyltransferase
MKKDHLRFLLCPGCRSDLQLAAIDRCEDEEVIEGKLACAGCRLSFAVARGVPRMLAGGKYALAEQTKKNFAYSWKKFADIYEDPRDFLDWIYPQKEDFFRDKIVCDAGCGTGKHAIFAADFGARQVVAFDLSSAVDVAFEFARPYRNILVVQADIYNLPLKPEFDYFYSIGVLQHLLDTEKGFRELARLLKPGGWGSIWVYGHEGTGLVRKFVDPVRRLTSRWPLFIVFSLSFFLTAAFYFLAKIISQPLSRIHFFRKAMTSLPLGPYLLYMSQFPFHYMFNSVFDQLIAPITQYFRREDVERWFQNAGYRNIVVTSRNDMSWRASGQKPS